MFREKDGLPSSIFYSSFVGIAFSSVGSNAGAGSVVVVFGCVGSVVVGGVDVVEFCTGVHFGVVSGVDVGRIEKKATAQIIAIVATINKTSKKKIERFEELV